VGAVLALNVLVLGAEAMRQVTGAEERCNGGLRANYALGLVASVCLGGGLLVGHVYLLSSSASIPYT
jgi:hypothetical protein